MISEFKKHIDITFPFLAEKKFLIACSGGLDSVALVHLCLEKFSEFGLAHCNFNLRGSESDEDELFVKDLATKHDLPFYSENFDTNKLVEHSKLSVQMAARELRYHWFDEISNLFNYDFILTAHHADDALETFLINISRASGLKGLTGISERNGKILRPLLPFSRKEILTFAKEKNFFWREDSSNAKSDYLRNALRNKVIPKLKENVPAFLNQFQQTQKHLQAGERLIDDYLTLVFNLIVTENFDGYTVHLEKLKDLPHTDELLYELLSPFNFTDFTAIKELLDGQSGKQIFSKTHVLLKDRNVLILTKNQVIEKDDVLITEDIMNLQTPIKLKFEDVDSFKITNSNTAFFDKDTLQFPLVLRKWRNGDTFHPFGMEGKKKLSKLFKDEKLSLVAKEKIFVLCSNEDIIWVVGVRLDDRFKVTKKTNSILKITFFPK